ncbi:TPA: DUF551 domain-containing protein [Serratia liquefaciens]|nr:DUF551 domain-containing protein [Serratia liquefaciens]
MKPFDKNETGELIAAIHSLGKDKVRELALLMWERIQELETTNSPETPDGWIACGERMPVKYKEVVLWCPETKEQFIGFYDGREYVYAQGPDGMQIVLILSDITHWQPCAAAPKPEK